MPNRLEPINLADFTGGLNLRSNQFQLGPNESPEMENIVIDPLGGIYTRKGWTRWNEDDIVDAETDTWDPRRALLMQLSDGTDLVYVVSDHELWVAPLSGVFTQLTGVPCNAVPHMADFAVFGDDLYIACGRETSMRRRRGTAAVTTLTASGLANWNDDYLTPTHGKAPKSELCEAHSGYLFVANIEEDGVDYPNRLRWSHPTSQDDWAQPDFIDIGVGGSKITALASYEDHLIIFKSDSIWALYGYDADSWQLVQKSTTAGTISPQHVTRNETAIFFFSGSDKGAVFAYGGERAIEIGVQVRRAFETILVPELIWVGWLGRKLWITVPWSYDSGPAEDVVAVLVFDPSVGDGGAWTYFTSTTARLGPLVGGSNIDSQVAPLGVLRDQPRVVRLDHLDLAADRLYDVAVWGGSEPESFIVTEDDEEIIMSGMPGDESFTTKYRTPWVTANWPTRKKSWRRADYICRISERGYDIAVESFRDYEERNVARRHTVTVPPSGAGAVWGQFVYGDGTVWGAGGPKRGALIRRGSSQGMCKAIQLRLSGAPRTGVYPAWGVDAVVLKVVLRRFR